MRAIRNRVVTALKNQKLQPASGALVPLGEIGQDEIRISSGAFMPDSQAGVYAKEAQKTLREFSAWESKNPSRS